MVASTAAIGGIALGTSAFASSSGSAPAGALSSTAVKASAKSAAQPVRHMAAKAITVQVAKGRVDGLSWSARLTYYPVIPKGAIGPLPPGMPAPHYTSLVCRRVSIGGVLVDHQGGPWADCDPVVGSHDPAWTDIDGPNGLHHKGVSGTRIFVGGTTDLTTAYGIVTFTDGTHVTGHTTTIPHTSYAAWAVPIPNSKTIATVDEYNNHHHRLTHQTNWQ